MTLTDREIQTIGYYEKNAALWAAQRKKITELSFWSEEYIRLKQLQEPKGKILEIGSGSGREALELIRIGYEYTGIDTSKELLTIARETASVGSFFYSTVYDLPFAEESFDAFSSWSMLPHIPKRRIDEALGSIKQVLKPGAVGFMAMREGQGEEEELGTGRWFSYYTQDEFEKILQKQGFQVEFKNKKPSRANLTWLTFFVRFDRLRALR